MVSLRIPIRVNVSGCPLLKCVGASHLLLVRAEIHMLSDPRGACLEGLVTRYLASFGRSHKRPLQAFECLYQTSKFMLSSISLGRSKMMQKSKQNEGSSVPCAALRFVALSKYQSLLNVWGKSMVGAFLPMQPFRHVLKLFLRCNCS